MASSYGGAGGAATTAFYDTDGGHHPRQGQLMAELAGRHQRREPLTMAHEDRRPLFNISGELEVGVSAIDTSQIYMALTITDSA